MESSRWADQDDSSGDEAPPPASLSSTPSGTSGPSGSGGITIPPTHSTRLDSKGHKTVTSYRLNPNNPNQLLKTTAKIKVTTLTVKESRAVERRRKWKPFGQAAVDEDQSNITIQSRDDVFIEDPHADVDLQDEDPAKALAGNLNEFWKKQQERQLQRKYDVSNTDPTAPGGPPASGGLASLAASSAGPSADMDDGWKKVGGPSPAGGPTAGKYVPPGARGRATTGKSLSDMANTLGDDAGGGAGPGGRRYEDRDQNTIRVTNISEDTSESDLQELFHRFGRISRVYLAKDKETLVSRGFAFVSFVHREDAQRAMEKLQGYGYDHLILKLEWAKPSAPKDPGQEGTQFRSGYGKALAQDTKEKVSYASNLTRGVR